MAARAVDDQRQLWCSALFRMGLQLIAGCFTVRHRLHRSGSVPISGLPQLQRITNQPFSETGSTFYFVIAILFFVDKEPDPRITISRVLNFNFVFYFIKSF